MAYPTDSLGFNVLQLVLQVQLVAVSVFLVVTEGQVVEPSSYKVT
jgi:hypothetical protein